MERNISRQPSDHLRTTRSKLDRRWQTLTRLIGEELGLSRRAIQVQGDYLSDGVWAGLVGSSCERILRDRGGPAFVAPLAVLPKGLLAWLGIYEVWGSAGRGYIFRHLSLTIHFGFEGDPVKPQVFRSEWVGLQTGSDSGGEFESGDIANPHWQFDLGLLIRSYLEEKEDGRANMFSENVLEDFENTITNGNVRELILSATLERLHFASSAPWWKVQEIDDKPVYVNAPSDEQSLSRWMVGCIAYLKHELVRCEIVVR